MKNKGILRIIVFCIASILIVGALYYRSQYIEPDFSQILFYLLNGVEHTSKAVVGSVFKSCVFYVLLLTAIFYFLQIETSKTTVKMNVKIAKKRFSIQVFPIKIIVKHRIIYSLVVLILAIIVFVHGFGIDDYIKNLMTDSEIYEKYYIDGRTVNITFPEKKRNLIFISAESMETTMCSTSNGGGWGYSIIPELEQLALNNINFSNGEKLGGALQIFSTHFTAAGLVAQTAGIPLKTPATLNASSMYYGNGKYLQNAYTLGDILEEQGYNLEIMMGSDGEFGGRTQYFQTNGNYKIFDVNYAINQGKMTAEQQVWWGFEDDKLFTWAKEETLELANSDKPFNLIIQTADTHFTDGYLSKYASNDYEERYENVYAYSSKLINEYVKWLQKQNFYKDTTIVIIGDHLGMQNDFYTSHIDENYTRGVYNVIINSAIDGDNTKNRQFSTMDLYPTILASMGVKIEGERLGLGTNLFSGKKTLIEEFGFDYVNEEIKKNSKFYNDYLLGEDYYLIKKHETNSEN